MSHQRQSSKLGCWNVELESLTPSQSRKWCSVQQSTPRLSVCRRLGAPEDAHVNKGMQFGRGKLDILHQQVLPAGQCLKPCIVVSHAGISIHWLISWNPTKGFLAWSMGQLEKMAAKLRRKGFQRALVLWRTNKDLGFYNWMDPTRDRFVFSIPYALVNEHVNGFPTTCRLYASVMGEIFYSE